MFCTKCGSKIEEGIKFCTKCGNPLIGMEQIVQNHNPQSIQSYVQPPRNNLLIVMIALSAFSIVFSGIVVIGPFMDDIINLADWFSAILVAIALAQGYINHSSFLKTSAFIALALRGVYFVSEFSNKIGSDQWDMVYQIISVTYFIQAVIFLVSAIQLLRKNAGNRK